MSLELNPRIQQLIASGAGPSGSPGFADFATGDALSEILDHGLARMSGLPAVPTVSAQTDRVTTADGHGLELRWYEKAGSSPGSAVVYLHASSSAMSSEHDTRTRRFGSHEASDTPVPKPTQSTANMGDTKLEIGENPMGYPQDVEEIVRTLRRAAKAVGKGVRRRRRDVPSGTVDRAL